MFIIIERALNYCEGLSFHIFFTSRSSWRQKFFSAPLYTLPSSLRLSQRFSQQICPLILNISLICDVRIIQFFISTFEYFKMVDRIIRSSIALKLSTPLSTYTNTYIYLYIYIFICIFTSVSIYTYIYTYTYIRIFIYYMYIHITHRHTYENNSLK